MEQACGTRYSVRYGRISNTIVHSESWDGEGDEARSGESLLRVSQMEKRQYDEFTTFLLVLQQTLPQVGRGEGREVLSVEGGAGEMCAGT